MALLDREIQRAKQDAEDTLRKNRDAVAASQRSVGKIRQTRERSQQRVKDMKRRLQSAGVNVDADGV